MITKIALAGDFFDLVCIKYKLTFVKVGIKKKSCKTKESILKMF